VSIRMVHDSNESKVYPIGDDLLIGATPDLRGSLSVSESALQSSISSTSKFVWTEA